MNNSQNKSTNKVSALDKALKLLVTVFNKVKHYLGVAIIDQGMRTIVSWYDKRHPQSSKRKLKQDNNQIVQLRVQIDELNEISNKLRNQLKIEKTNCTKKNTTIDELHNEIRLLNNDIIQIKSTNNQLNSSVEALTKQKNELLRRCLPESEIPSMVYYAQGDASGLNLRKLSTTKVEEHIYKLVTNPGDTTSAVFVPIVESNCQEIIANRSVTLIACNILSISANATSIKVVEPGKARFENNKWVVTSKAQIHLS